MGCVYLKSKQCYNAKPSAYYFHMETKILVDFHICISLPLILDLKASTDSNLFKWLVAVPILRALNMPKNPIHNVQFS